MVNQKDGEPLAAWDVLEQQVLYDAFPWVRLISEHVRLPNGVEIDDFYRVEISPYVMIFAVTPERQVAMVEHYKHGPHMVSLELPAGYIEADDDPLSTAQRELREEMGMESDDWQSLGRYFIDGNRGCGWMHGFLARDARVTTPTEHEATELLTLHFKSLDEVFQRWVTGAISNVAASHVIGRGLLELGYLTRS